MAQLEEDFHHNNFGPPENVHLSIRPLDMHRAMTPQRIASFNTQEDARLARIVVSATEAAMTDCSSKAEAVKHLVNRSTDLAGTARIVGRRPPGVKNAFRMAVDLKITARLLSLSKVRS